MPLSLLVFSFWRRLKLLQASFERFKFFPHLLGGFASFDDAGV